MDKDKSLIPKGDYCYTYENDKYKKCPYWTLKNDLPEHENGYCYYLEKSDYDNNEEIGRIKWKSKGKISFSEPHEIPISLIWDQCKECGINLDDEYED